MPVDQASYRAYEGTRRPGRRVAFAIAGTMIRKMRRGRLVRYFVYGFPAFTCLISVLVFAVYYMNRNAFSMFRFEGANVLVLMNRAVQDQVGFFALLVAALVGSPLIAEDRRARALPLYFSRPVTRFDYVMGKMLTVLFFLGVALLGPPLLMYIAEISLNPAEGVILDQLPTLGNSMIPSLARIVSMSAVVLGISSLVRRTNHAALLLFGILVAVQIMAFVFARGIFRDPSWLALSPKECLDRITAEYLAVPARALRRGRHVHALAPMDLGAAWTSLCLWTGAGLALLVARIRKVEVVA